MTKFCDYPEISSQYDVLVIGAGLSGSEAALSLAKLGYKVALFEMRPEKMTDAHHGAKAAELVCSNSLKSRELMTAAGLLKKELELLGSSLILIAYENSVPAGSALAVDREAFSSAVEDVLNRQTNIDIFREEFTCLNALIGTLPILIAAGPLASDALSEELQSFMGESMSFMDAAAPIVMRDSLNFDRVFPASRYGKGEADDYLNVAFTKAEYERFYEELVSARRVINKDFEQKDLFSACQPVEEVARKSFDALRFGSLKPVGISDPNSDERPFAVMQLRAETRDKSAYNLVGFQTNLSWPEQKRVFSLIPGLENAEFARLGVMHRNTFINAPQEVKYSQEHKQKARLYFAGQIVGTEGYTEAIASGLMAALQIDRACKGLKPLRLPETGALGSLYSYAFNDETEDYQPMHVNYGLMAPLPQRVKNKRLRYIEYARRALSDFETFLSQEEIPLKNEDAAAILGAAHRELDEKAVEIAEQSKKKREKKRTD